MGRRKIKRKNKEKPKMGRSVKDEFWIKGKKREMKGTGGLQKLKRRNGGKGRC
jgi:hypothetical protein